MDDLFKFFVGDTKIKCPHCGIETTTGMNGGCHGCGRVKTSGDGRRPPRYKKKEEPR